MALLLAMFQKMRITRELNEYTLRDAKISSKKSRIQKNIERTQKRYTSLIAQIDQQAKMMASQAKVMFNQTIGMDMMNSNPYSGMSIFVMNAAGSMLANGIGRKDKDGKDIDPIKLDSDQFQALLEAQYNRTLQPDYEDDNKTYKKVDGKVTYLDGKFTEDDINAFNYAMRMAQTQQQQAQMWAQQQTSNFESNVSIWAEARKAELEAEQDAMLEPLNYEDTMLDLEKESVEARLTQLRAEKESYDQLCKEEAKNSAPTFGLG